MFRSFYIFLKDSKYLSKIVPIKLIRKISINVHLIIFGSIKTRNFVKRILNTLFAAKFRNEWIYSNEAPHFYDFEEYDQNFNEVSDYNSLQRGYQTSGIIEKGDILCDIGCGGGFFTKKFYSFKCESIDAIDTEITAINYAKKYNSSKKINYFNFDVLLYDLPRKNYDVIVLDGTLGHFSELDTDKLMKKISESLNERGLFVGSESLGIDADDHFQYWNNQKEMKEHLQKYFKYVYCRTIEYPIKPFYNQIRKECYWRCGNTRLSNDRLLINFKN